MRIPHFFFKGIALVGRFYRIEERQLADIDLFVAPAERNAALAVLHGRGYADLREPGGWRPDVERPGITMTRTEGDTLLDVHWGLETVNALSSAATVLLPPAVWRGVAPQGGLPVPHDEHHLALVLHHLVRHDLLHVRGLLDVALLWHALPHDAGHEASELAVALGVRRALGVVGRAVVDGLSLYPLRGIKLGASDWRRRRVARHLGITDWLVWAARHSDERPSHVTLTLRRAWLRWLLADEARLMRLIGEVLRPPAGYLVWRYPEAGPGRAWRAHLRACVRG